MENINKVLNIKRISFTKRNNTRPINEKYERAKAFALFLGVSPLFILRLFKIYGMGKVLGLESWIRDYPIKSSPYGLLVWKLKELSKNGEKPNIDIV
jgi:hypothetical protein